MSAAIKTRLFNWLPHDLAGYDYPVVETDNIVPDLIAPAITYYFSSFSASQPGWRLLGTIRNNLTGGLDEFWGSYFYCTMNVVLRSNDKDELSTMWLEFLTQLESTRRDLLLRWDGVRFVEILGMKPLPPERLDSGKDLYWAQLDLRFEFIIFKTPDAELIKRVHTDITVALDEGGTEATYSMDREAQP